MPQTNSKGLTSMGTCIYLFGILNIKKIMFLKLLSDFMFLYSYFRILVQQFEVQLQQYRQQIEELENHLATQANNSHIAPQGNMLSVVIFFYSTLFCFVVCGREVKLLLNSRYSSYW